MSRKISKMADKLSMMLSFDPDYHKKMRGRLSSNPERNTGGIPYTAHGAQITPPP